MSSRLLVFLTLGCFALAAVPFWLWKLYPVTRPQFVHILIWLFVLLFSLGLVFGFALGARLIFALTPNWAGRGLLLVLLVGIELYVALMAALGMNFVGQ